MKTINAACATVVLMAISMSAVAAEPMMDHGDEMKRMDTNGDGMLSKAEFTKHHDAMWMKMPKTSSGMVDLKAMKSMKGALGNGFMESGSMGKGAMGSDSSMGRDSMKGAMGNGSMESGSMDKGAMGSDSSMGRDSMPADKRSSDPTKK